jgi:organic hydroperoxide reductase OsmC/OhrA
MATPLPHRYVVALEGTTDDTAWLAAPPRPLLLGGPPPEFGGQDTQWSPEHLLLGSVSLCLATTFRALAKREGLAIRAYAGQAEGVLDRTPDGLAFTSLTLQVELCVDAEDVARAEQLLRRAKKQCLIGNSLKAPIGLEVSVQARASRPVAMA